VLSFKDVLREATWQLRAHCHSIAMACSVLNFGIQVRKFSFCGDLVGHSDLISTLSGDDNFVEALGLNLRFIYRFRANYNAGQFGG
jgi:uncharacterized membrane protein